jgi:hypothetical protein
LGFGLGLRFFSHGAPCDAFDVVNKGSQFQHIRYVHSERVSKRSPTARVHRTRWRIKGGFSCRNLR